MNKINKLPKTLIAVAMLLSTAVSSLASESTAVTPVLLPSINPAPLTAPTVLSKKVALNSAELAKYQLLSDQSHGLATQQAAGAFSTTEKVLIGVGVVLVVLLVASAADIANAGNPLAGSGSY